MGTVGMGYDEISAIAENAWEAGRKYGVEEERDRVIAILQAMKIPQEQFWTAAETARNYTLSKAIRRIQGGDADGPSE